MAIDVKKLIVDAFLDLCKVKNLHKLTLQEIVAASGVSRQTFYNHFADKLALIQYTYKTRIIFDFLSPENVELGYAECVLRSMLMEKEYVFFMKPACEITGQNCLTDYMYKHSVEFDEAYYQYFYGDEPMSPLLKSVSEYHSYAAMHMHIQWILKGCVEPPEQYIDIWVKARINSMNELIFDSKPNSPYTMAAVERNII